MNAPTRIGIPIRPDPLARDREERRALIRTITGIALTSPDRGTADKIVAREWPGDTSAGRIAKAAVTQMTLEDSGLPLVTNVEVLPSLAPLSAAVRLFARCLRVSLDGVNDVKVPRGVSDTSPIFVAEGAPAPVVKITFTNSKLGPARKILTLSAVTAELEKAAPETVSGIIGTVIADGTTKKLDGVVFDAGADDGVRPAGLLFGLTATGASASTGSAAIAADLASLAGAIADNGIGGDDIVLVTNPRQAVTLRWLAGPSFNSAVLGTSAVPDGRVIAIAASAVASAYSGVPTIEKSKEAAIHFEDTSPANIGEAAGVAAPTRSAFQTEMIVLRIRARAAWARVAPGVAFIDSVNW